MLGRKDKVYSEARCLSGFVKTHKYPKWEYSCEFECSESKSEQAPCKNALCVGLKRKGMVCVVQMKGKHRGMLTVGFQLLC